MFDRLQSAFLDLESLIRKGEQRVVPFIGAGLSVYGPPEERLPLWSQLLWKLKERCEEYGLASPTDSEEISKLIAEGKLIAAVDHTIDLIGEKQFRLFIEGTFDVRGKPIPPAIMQLITISWSLIVTTNLDNFIERAWLEHYGHPIEVVTNIDKLKFAQAVSGVHDHTILAKIHGTVERYESWILSEKHYALLLQKDHAYTNTLKNLFLRVLFFVGYGLNDGDFQILLDQVYSIYPAGVGEFFALLDSRLKGTSALKRLIRDYGVRPIWYNYDPSRASEPDGGYGEVLECLQILVEAWVRTKKVVPIKLKYFPELEPEFVGRSRELNQLAESILSEPARSVQIIGFGGEGKTSLVQKFISTFQEELATSDYQAIFGCSFYRSDVGRFINDAYSSLHPNPRPLDIASKVAELTRLVASSPILLVLDGTEVVQQDDGKLANPYLEDILVAAIEGNSKVIATTRTPLSYQLERLYLEPLSEQETANILHAWGFESDYHEVRRFIRDKVGRHALSVRIFAGLARSVSARDVDALGQVRLIEIPDEADRLRANKAARVLEFYQQHLSEEARLFMECFSIFRRPIAVSTVLHCLFEGSTTPSRLAHLKSRDFRPIIYELLERRLLILETGSLLTAHPLVREYFSRQLSRELAIELNRQVALHFLSISQESIPASFDDYLILFDACYHAACSNEWNLFHDIFFRRLNREHENFVGNTLGAWEEFLDLALLTFPERNPSREPVIFPTYYRASVARAFKHLGRSVESKDQYIECIKLCARQREPETARYINNFLSISISMGRLSAARKLAVLNAATLKWMDIEWRRRWQTEFALFSIGYLCCLLGDRDMGENLCQCATHVWDQEGDERKWFFDYYRSYYVDIILAMAGREDEAVSIALKSLEIGERYGWRETIAVALRSLGAAYRNIYCFSSHNEADWDIASGYLMRAQAIADDLRIPRLEIDVLLERARLDLAQCVKHHREGSLPSIEKTKRRLAFLIDQCCFELYRPELIALNGWLHLIRSETPAAETAQLEAVEYARRIGNIMVMTNHSSLLASLSKELGMAVYPEQSYDPVFTRVEDFFAQEVSWKELLKATEDLRFYYD